MRSRAAPAWGQPQPRRPPRRRASVPRHPPGGALSCSFGPHLLGEKRLGGTIALGRISPPDLVLDHES